MVALAATLWKYVSTRNKLVDAHEHIEEMQTKLRSLHLSTAHQSQAAAAIEASLTANLKEVTRQLTDVMLELKEAQTVLHEGKSVSNAHETPQHAHKHQAAQLQVVHTELQEAQSIIDSLRAELNSDATRFSDTRLLQIYEQYEQGESAVLRSLESTLDQVHTQLASSQRDTSSLKEENARLVFDMKTIQSKLTLCQGAFHKCNARISQLQRELQESKKKLVQEQTKHGDLLHKLEDVRTQYQGAETANGSLIVSHTARVRELTQMISDLENTVKNKEQELSDCMQEATAFSHGCVTLSHDLYNKNAELRDITQKLEDSTAENQRLNAELQRLQQHLDAVNATSLQNEQNLHTLAAELQLHHQNAAMYTSQIATLRQEQNQHQQQAEALHSELGELVDSLALHIKENTQLESQLNELKQMDAALRVQLETITHESNFLQQQKDEHIANLQTELQNASLQYTKSLNEAQAQIKKLESRLGKYKGQLAKLKRFPSTSTIAHGGIFGTRKRRNSGTDALDASEGAMSP